MVVHRLKIPPLESWFNNFIHILTGVYPSLSLFVSGHPLASGYDAKRLTLQNLEEVVLSAPRVPLNDMFCTGMNGKIGKHGWCCGSTEHGQSASQEAARTPSSLLIRGDLCRVSRSAGPKAEKVRWCWRARGPRGTPHAVPAETPSYTRRPRPWRPAPQVKF